jgi:hypothetical protein
VNSYLLLRPLRAAKCTPKQTPERYLAVFEEARWRGVSGQDGAGRSPRRTNESSIGCGLESILAGQQTVRRPRAPAWMTSSNRPEAAPELGLLVSWGAWDAALGGAVLAYELARPPF